MTYDPYRAWPRVLLRQGQPFPSLAQVMEPKWIKLLGWTLKWDKRDGGESWWFTESGIVIDFLWCIGHKCNSWIIVPLTKIERMLIRSHTPFIPPDKVSSTVYIKICLIIVCPSPNHQPSMQLLHPLIKERLTCVTKLTKTSTTLW